MNHSADRLRMLEGLFLICNFVIFFLPELSIRQENYPEQTFSQFSFFQDYFLSGSDAVQASVSGNMRLLTVLFILIPVLLAVLFSIGSFIDKIPNRYIAIGGIAVGVLSLMHLLLAKGIWPKRLNDAQSYDRRIGWWFLAIAMLGTLFSAILLLAASIQGAAAKKEMIRPEQRKDEQTMQQSRVVSSSHPRGVMVGIAGVFRGAEIVMQDGEIMHLGRDLSNDLVFQDAAHISRMHCNIIWQAEQQNYLIEDHSSNGCYINNASERLPQNVQIALEPGTIIDIGDRTNRFRLE